MKYGLRTLFLGMTLAALGWWVLTAQYSGRATALSGWRTRGIPVRVRSEGNRWLSFAGIRGTESIEAVEFSSFPMSSTDFKWIALFPEIEELDIDSEGLTESEARTVGTLPNLRYLQMRTPNATDRCLEILSTSQLERVRFATTPLTPQQLTMFARGASMKRIELWRTGISAEDADCARAAFPKIVLRRAEDVLGEYYK